MEFYRPEYCSGSHSLFQGIFLTQWLNPGILHCRQIPYYLSHHDINDMYMYIIYSVTKEDGRAVLKAVILLEYHWLVVYFSDSVWPTTLCVFVMSSEMCKQGHAIWVGWTCDSPGSSLSEAVGLVRFSVKESKSVCLEGGFGGLMQLYFPPIVCNKTSGRDILEGS